MLVHAHFFIMKIDFSKKKSLVPCWILLTSLDQKPVIKFVWPKVNLNNSTKT